MCRGEGSSTGRRRVVPRGEGLSRDPRPDRLPRAAAGRRDRRARADRTARNRPDAGAGGASPARPRPAGRGLSAPGHVRDLARISEVRVALEPEAARLAAERTTEADRSELDALLRELDGDGERDDRELMALDERIHRAVYRSAHNDLLETTLEQYYVLALRIWVIALDRQHEMKGAVQGHRAVLAASRDGDSAGAAETMRAHVQNFEQAMHRVLLTV